MMPSLLCDNSSQSHNTTVSQGQQPSYQGCSKCFLRQALFGYTWNDASMSSSLTSIRSGSLFSQSWVKTKGLSMVLLKDRPVFTASSSHRALTVNVIALRSSLSPLLLSTVPQLRVLLVWHTETYFLLFYRLASLKFPQPRPEPNCYLPSGSK